MADFGLIKSFDIDDGELDGFSPQECFVLGYELAVIDELLKSGEGISKLVHAANADRISKSCEDSRRPWKLEWMQGDVSESWMTLEVSESD